MPAVCNAAARCGIYASTSLCNAASMVYDTCATTAAMRDGRTVFDSSAANSCLNQSGSSCDIDYTSCSAAQRGTGTLNAPCFGANECEPNLACVTNTCPGTCQPRTPLGGTYTGAECVSGSYLYGSTCQPYLPVGQSCAPVSPQVSDRQCVASAFCSSGTKICTTKRTAGQSCTMSYSECGNFLTCWGGVCGAAGNLGSPCDGTRACKYGYKCGATNTRVNTGAMGAPCTSQFGDCEPNLICDIPAGGTQGTCGRVHTLGDSCTYNGYQCGFIGSLYCTATSVSPNGSCAMKKGQGASCGGYEECLSSTCTNSVCAGCVDPTP